MGEGAEWVVPNDGLDAVLAGEDAVEAEAWAAGRFGSLLESESYESELSGESELLSVLSGSDFFERGRGRRGPSTLPSRFTTPTPATTSE